jgi:hypothetical protein
VTPSAVFLYMHDVVEVSLMLFFGIGVLFHSVNERVSSSVGLTLD